MRLDRPEVLQSTELRQLFTYWSEHRADDRPPSRAEIDPIDVPQLLPDLLLADVDWSDDRPRYHYRLAGTRFTRFYGEEITGRWLDDLQLGSWLAFWEREYQAVAERWEPRYGVDAAVWQGRDFLRFEWLLLPLVAPSRRCEMILVGVRFDGSDGLKLRPAIPEDAGAGETAASDDS